ncbi:helix-turn-helix domain-containing protein [Rhizobium sp. P44RR-XXIV]|uniref:helix-turn-helix domain-containing protein n=1 Tax=Rhizobium sp. P44RR-XXIV TaxID=1921145 RepID=UPI00098696A0|nr:helix-turn-helix domain-containing protein [Rhizobium sp. P44RR-XXIV]TIX90016.1 DNA-binding protein [Rhizobium sp. P44RR-XXIV]
MIDPKIQQAALYYVRFTKPLDPDLGWRSEDVQLAFMAGAEAPPVARLMSLREVADALAVSVSTVNDLVRFGELAYIHAGRGTERKHLTFRPEEIESFIKRHTRRDYRDPGPSTARQSVKRKRADELAVERATASSHDFSAQLEARRAAAKARKK